MTAASALVIDDNPTALAWAAQAGARTLLVGRRAGAGAFPQIDRPADLPRFLQSPLGT